MFFIVFTYILMPHNIIILSVVYLISMSQIVFYFLHSSSVLSFYIDVVLTLSVAAFHFCDGCIVSISCCVGQCDTENGLVIPVSTQTWHSTFKIFYEFFSESIDIKKNAWVTVNNDFWVTSEAICQWFSQVTKSWVKIIGKSHHKWPKNHYSQ